MTPSWLSLASSKLCLSVGGPLPLLALASLLLRSPILGAAADGDSAAHGARAQLSPPALPAAGQKVPWGEGAGPPGRGQRVQSKLAFRQHSAWVSAFSQWRIWARFGQRPIQSPVLEYASFPHPLLLSPENPGGQTSCSHPGLPPGWLDIISPLQEKN